VILVVVPAPTATPVSGAPVISPVVPSPSPDLPNTSVKEPLNAQPSTGGSLAPVGLLFLGWLLLSKVYIDRRARTL
jgi:hypothetical protein